MNIKIEFPSITDLCHYCLGSGKLKAMQSGKSLGSNRILRVQDTEVECPHCEGTRRQ
jgi:hypothetical protein